jgi:hypothetical protein
MLVEQIYDLPDWDGDEGLLAVIAYLPATTSAQPARPTVSGTRFLTAEGMPLQLGIVTRGSGETIPAHRHPVQERKVYTQTHEVLIVQKGRMRVDFYNSRNMLVASRTLGVGDIVLLCAGGHGFEMLEDTQLIEVKQGPYLARDKVSIE